VRGSETAAVDIYRLDGEKVGEVSLLGGGEIRIGRLTTALGLEPGVYVLHCGQKSGELTAKLVVAPE
jgi:hypothetical protein